MASEFVSSLQNLWPFSVFKYDDLKVSDGLVRKLSIPENTKQFVFAIKVPETGSIIYILSTQNLSEQSARDAERLIREIRPDAVVAQVGNMPVSGIEAEEIELGENSCDVLPVSVFGVLKRCITEKTSKEKYEQVAGNVVLREIFGVGFHGHVMAAKKVAHEVGSSFLVIESAFRKSSHTDSNVGEGDMLNKFHGLVTCLVPQKLGPVVTSYPRRLCLNDDIQYRMVKMLSTCIDLSGLKFGDSEAESKEVVPKCDYEAPPFAHPIYTRLVDLRDIFSDIPFMGSALAYAQKMLSDVNDGKVMDHQAMSGVYAFRVAVEGLRMALNNAGRLPVNKNVNSNSSRIDFSELPGEEKSQVLFVQALRSQAETFKTIVAVVDSSALAGLRKHWRTPVTSDIKDLVEQNVRIYDSNGELLNTSDKKSLLGKPLVAVGAGATAVLGVSSLSKTVPVSTFIKLLTFKVPASLKLSLTQIQKVMALGFTKTLGPAKMAVPGVASSGAKTSILKATASAEKIHSVAHGAIAYAQNTSLSAMRTAFYEIMRKRRARPIGLLPWTTFGCSIATCAVLVAYGEGIECAAESLPAAPSIANLGRGIQSLHQASQSVQEDKSAVQKSIEYLMCRLKKVKVQ